MKDDISKSLVNIGFDEKTAKVIGVVLQTPGKTQKQLTEELALTQRTVAGALNFMELRGWIHAVQQPPTRESGRPANTYYTIMSIERIMNSIGDEKATNVKNTINEIEKLKKLLASTGVK